MTKTYLRKYFTRNLNDNVWKLVKFSEIFLKFVKHFIMISFIKSLICLIN